MKLTFEIVIETAAVLIFVVMAAVCIVELAANGLTHRHLAISAVAYCLMACAIGVELYQSCRKKD